MRSNSAAVLELKNISKSYGDIKALADIDYTFSLGIYGILGPNGAGKSTLMKIISQSIKQTSGAVLYNGKTCDRSFLNCLGVMPQGQELYPKFSVNEFMFYMATLKNMKTKKAKIAIPELLKVVGLADYRHRKIESLSGGMKQRLLIAQALLNDPKIILFDEPTAGLDPNQRVEIRNFLATLAIDHIVIITTHVVSDVETIADDILLMNKGKIVANGNPADLSDAIYGKVKEITVDDKELACLKNHPYTIIASKQDTKIIRIISEDSYPDEKIVYPSLEDVYSYYIKE